MEKWTDIDRDTVELMAMCISESQGRDRPWDDMPEDYKDIYLDSAQSALWAILGKIGHKNKALRTAVILCLDLRDEPLYPAES